MNIKEWQILLKDLKLIEKDLTRKEDVSLKKEEQFIDLLLRNEAKKISENIALAITDEEIDEIWESTKPETLPSKLNSKVLEIIDNKTANKQQAGRGYLFAPSTVALAFRKEAQLDKGEVDLIQSAIERAKERLRSQEGEDE